MSTETIILWIVAVLLVIFVHYPIIATLALIGGLYVVISTVYGLIKSAANRPPPPPK